MLNFESASSEVILMYAACQFVDTGQFLRIDELRSQNC